MSFVSLSCSSPHKSLYLEIPAALKPIWNLLAMTVSQNQTHLFSSTFAALHQFLSNPLEAMSFGGANSLTFLDHKTVWGDATWRGDTLMVWLPESKLEQKLVLFFLKITKKVTQKYIQKYWSSQIIIIHTLDETVQFQINICFIQGPCKALCQVYEKCLKETTFHNQIRKIQAGHWSSSGSCKPKQLPHGFCLPCRYLLVFCTTSLSADSPCCHHISCLLSLLYHTVSMCYVYKWFPEIAPCKMCLSAHEFYITFCFCTLQALVWIHPHRA